MPNVTVWSFAKVNFSLDVTGVDEKGYHEIDTIMHQLRFHDDVHVRYAPYNDGTKGSFDISVKTNLYFLPTDSRNLAYKAAALMADKYGSSIKSGEIKIDILKRIPVAAGLAGGSGNAAAVIHALNMLWGLRLPLKEIMDISAELGSDIPFCAMGQAGTFYRLPAYIRKDEMASPCARATGTGTILKPLRPVNKAVVFSKPRISVSTADVYKGIDSCVINEHPDNDEFEKQLTNGGQLEYNNFINVLENFTLRHYPKVGELKEFAEKELTGARKVMMSGSGPTIFAVYDDLAEAKEGCMKLRNQGYEAYWTLTSK